MVFSYRLLCDPARSALDQLITRLVLFRSPGVIPLGLRFTQLRHLHLKQSSLVALPTLIAVTAANFAALFSTFSPVSAVPTCFSSSRHFISWSLPSRKCTISRIHSWERAFIFCKHFCRCFRCPYRYIWFHLDNYSHSKIITNCTFMIVNIFHSVY